MQKNILVIIVCLSQLVANAQCAVQEQTNCTFRAIGHRAYSHIYPENTLEALEEAFKRGIKYCEVDVSLTKDNVYVLFHDENALNRTTNGYGKINELTVAEIKQLDAGSWKDSVFTNTKVPTLSEALILAEKYNAQLYLDTKDFSSTALKNALTEAKVASHRLFPSISSIEDAQLFRTVLPNTPWVWYNGGLYPDDINDANFYTACINLGCIAFEVGWSLVDTTTDWRNFAKNVHAVSSKVWVFTVNDNDIAQKLVNQGVDGIETDRPVALQQVICNGTINAFPDSITTANWRLTNSLTNSIHVGSQLRPFNYALPNAKNLAQFNSCAGFGIAALSNDLDSVMYVDPNTLAEGLLVYTNFSVNDEGTEDFSYTILLDFLIPTASFGNWIALYQTSIGNTNDAELFISPSGSIGVVGDYFGNLTSNTWYRLAIVYDGDLQELRLFINGSYLGRAKTFSNRWAVFNSSPRGENQGFRMFCDNDGETQALYLSAMQLRDYRASFFEIAALGGPSSKGFPCTNVDILRISGEGVLNDSTKIDYDQQTIELTLDKTTSLNQVRLKLVTSSGSQSDLNPLQAIDFSNLSKEVTVTAESGKQKKWIICAHQEQTTSINELDLIDLVIFPNPTNQNINFSKQIAHWEIYNILGLLVHSGKTSTGANLEGLANGHYSIKLSNLTSSVSKQFILIR